MTYHARQRPLAVDRLITVAIRFTLVLSLTCSSGCGGDQEAETSTPGDTGGEQTQATAPGSVSTATSRDSLVEEELGSTKNVHRLGETWLCGQPSVEDLEMAKERGIDVVLTLRGQDEVPWDEQAEVEKLGMQFHRVDFQGPETLTDDVFDQARTVMRDASAAGSTVMLHCGSANRVGAIWMVYRVLDEGIDVATAEAEALEIGLRTEEYKARALEYLNKLSGN